MTAPCTYRLRRRCKGGEGDGKGGEERRGQKEVDNGEQIEKMDVETETRSGRRLEGQLDQAGEDKTGIESMSALYF